MNLKKEFIQSITYLQVLNSQDGYINKYQQVIQKQDYLINQLLNKIQFLEKDRTIFINEIIELNTKLKRYEMNQTLQICIPTQKYQQSLSNSHIFKQVSQQSYSQNQLHKNQMINSNINQLNTEKEFSIEMSNSKDDLLRSSGNVKRTPVLYEPLYIDKKYRCKYNLLGMLRCFYIKLLCESKHIIKLIQIIESEYIQSPDGTNILYVKYPDNKLIGSIMISYLDKVSKTKKCIQVIQYLNNYQMIDQILCQVLFNMLSVYADIDFNIQLNQAAAKKYFWGLSNCFDLTFIYEDNRYSFYEEIDMKKRVNSDQSQLQVKVYEQISLNPHQRDKSISFIDKSQRQALFTIEYNPQTNYFQYTMRQQKQSQDILFYSHLQMDDDQGDKSPCQFLSNNKDSSHRLSRMNSNNHFVDVPSILSNSRDYREQKLSVVQSDESRRQFQRVKRNYFQLKYQQLMMSKESMLLSSYNNSNRKQNQFQITNNARSRVITNDVQKKKQSKFIIRKQYQALITSSACNKSQKSYSAQLDDIYSYQQKMYNF